MVTLHKTSYISARAVRRRKKNKLLDPVIYYENNYYTSIMEITKIIYFNILLIIVTNFCMTMTFGRKGKYIFMKQSYNNMHAIKSNYYFVMN